MSAAVIARNAPAFRPEDWTLDAACRGADPGVFYPDERRSDAANPEAITICARCPVARECLTYALEHREEHGIWGGLNPSQRRQIQRRRTA